MSVADALKLMKEKGVKFVDLRLTDTRGKEQHVSVPAHVVDEAFFTDGKMFDGSSIAGWKGINDSDMILMPDAETAVIDVFTEEPTMILRCDVIEPSTMQGYERDPRSAAKRAEAYLKSTGIADQAFFGPENEFFVFDDVRWASEMHGAFYAIESSEGYVANRQGDARRQHGPPSGHQGRLLPGPARRLAARHPRGNVPRARGDGSHRRGAPPRGRERRPMRDRRDVRRARRKRPTTL